jgi:transcriptional regulator GlxA family with amidase domain
VERARDLILSTSLPLKEIAPAVGLGDVFRLGKLFREQLGTTPAGLRRMKGRGR